MSGEKFDRAKFIKEKVSEYAPKIADVIAKVSNGDATGAMKAAEDIMMSVFEELIDDSVKNSDEAERKTTESFKKKLGIYLDGKWIVIDYIIDHVKFNTFKLNHDGSSYGEAISRGQNTNLRPYIDRSSMLYGFKEIFGLVADTLIDRLSYGAVGFFVSIKDIATANHSIVIDYKDKDSHVTKERKYVIYNAKGNARANVYEAILRSHWDDIGQDIHNPSLNRVIVGTDKSDSDAEMVFYREYGDRSDLKNTFEIRKGKGDDVLVPFLKRLKVGFEDDKNAHVKFGSDDPKEIVANYFANFGAGASRVSGDLQREDKKLKLAAAYALETLKGYALAGSAPKSEYTNLQIHSKKHIEDRISMLSRIVSTGFDAQGDILFKDLINEIYQSNLDNGEINHRKEIIFGSNGGNKITTKAQSSYIYAMGGDDTIVAVSSDSYIEGGEGSDRITTGPGKDTIYTNADINPEHDYDSGTNTVRSGAGSDTIHGSKAKDVIYGEDGDDTIYGREGSDELYGGSGNDTIYTNDKMDDKLDKENENTTNLVVAGQGKDTVYGSAGKDIIYGDDKENDGNNTHMLGSDSDTIYGKGGDDVIYAGNDKDTVHGGKGNDEIHGGDDKDTLHGDEDDDTIYGDEGNDTIYGGSGNDEIHGGDDDDTLYGGEGDDTIYGDDGDDTIYGGNSHKGAQIGATTDNISQDGASEQNVLVGGGGKDTIYGTKGNDVVYGDELSEDIEGSNTLLGSEKDRIYTYDGDDIVYGGGDDDVIYTGAGNDTVYGGDGNDFIDAASDNSNDSAGRDGDADENTIYGGKGNDTIYGGKGKDIIDGGEGDDAIYAGDGDNEITDMHGKNSITTGKGNDTITTGDGEDTISGGEGSDKIKSGGGKDILSAGLDSDEDTLEGGEGDDEYHVYNNDTIIDSDGKGKVWFNSTSYLTGGVETKPGSKIYTGGGYTYHLNGSNLKVVQDSTKYSITIKDYSKENKSLNIKLVDKVGINISDNSADEGDGLKNSSATVNISLTKKLEGDQKIELIMPNNQKLIFDAITQSNEYKYQWKGDFAVNSEKKRNVKIKPLLINNDGVYAEVIKEGNLTITDDDTPVNINVEGNGTQEAAEKMKGSVSLSRDLKNGEYVSFWINGQKKTFRGKKIRDKFDIKWKDDKIPEEDSKFYHNVYNISSNATVKIPEKGGKFIIADDDRKKPPVNPRTYDPIVIDLNKDGLHLTQLNPALNFDHDSNDFKEATGWISNDDAFLTYDKNGNGIIDDGSEMFGETSAVNGFEALKKFDDNKDGKIDENDAIWQKLSLWRDINSDAKTDEGELISIKDTDIKSIDLNYSNTHIASNGNTIKQVSKVEFKDGSSATANDVNFEVDLSDTVQTQIHISKDVLDMPNVEAKGNVYDLHSAMMKDAKLKEMVRGYMSSNDPSYKKQLARDIIFRWTNTENIAKNSRGDMKDARELGVYEALMGEKFVHVSQGANPRGAVAEMLHGLYQEFENYVYSSLELQTTYKDAIDTEYMYYNHEDNSLGYKFDDFNKKIKELYLQEKHAEIIKLIALVKQASVYKPNLQSSFENNLKALAGNDQYLLAITQSTYIQGTLANDTLRGDEGNDYMVGNAGNDILYGEAGNDILYGGEGDDQLYGGEGDDTYVFNKGDGNDTIYDEQGNNIVKFGEGIGKEDLTFAFTGSNLSIKYGSSDTVTVNGYTNNTAYQIDKIELGNGNFITNSQINKIIQDINAYAKDHGITSISHDTIRNNQDMMNLVMSGWNS